MQKHQNLRGSLNVRFILRQRQKRKNSLTKDGVKNCTEEKSLKPNIPKSHSHGRQNEFFFYTIL